MSRWARRKREERQRTALVPEAMAYGPNAIARQQPLVCVRPCCIATWMGMALLCMVVGLVTLVVWLVPAPKALTPLLPSDHDHFAPRPRGMA